MREWICILRFDFHAFVIRDVHTVGMKREYFEDARDGAFSSLR